MNNQAFEINITPAKVEAWRKDLDEINQEIKKLIERRVKLQGRLNSIHLFLEEDQAEQVSLPGLPQEVSGLPELSESASPANEILPLKEFAPPDAIRSVLQEAGKPLTKNEIRERLKLANYPMGRFRSDGGYFHTIISRMARAREIRVDDGGRIMMLK